MVPAGTDSLIRLAQPDIDGADVAAVTEVLRSGHLVQGRHVAEFEDHLARLIGAPTIVAVSNCTAALHLALLAVGVSQGDSVAVATYSWPATGNVIALCGARAVFVDIEPATFTMNPSLLREALEKGTRSGKPLKAILPVHAFGAMADMPAICALADEYGVPVIEDAACALGAELNGRQAGAWGALGCFSFHPRKAVTTGEGGAIATQQGPVERSLRALRNHGVDPDAPSPDFILPGFNLRMTEFQAALGLQQLAKMGRLIECRRSLARRYDELLRCCPVTTPRTIVPEAHVYQSYVVLLSSEAATRRADIIVELRSRGIEAAIGTHHIPLTTYFRSQFGYRPGDFPVTDDVAARAMALPLHSRLTNDDQERVVACLQQLLC